MSDRSKLVTSVWVCIMMFLILSVTPTELSTSQPIVLVYLFLKVYVGLSAYYAIKLIIKKGFM